MVESRTELDLVFKALADPSRRAMLQMLTQGERSVGQLAEPLDMTLAGASKHIGVLELAGLVFRERRGRERICIPQAAPLQAAQDWITTYSRFWEGNLDALDQVLKMEDGDE